MTEQRTLTKRTMRGLARRLDERRGTALEMARAFLSEARDAQATADVSDRLDPASPIGAAADESYALAEHAFDTAAEAEAALRRIVDGTYGTCVDCRGDIPVARLRAVPSTTTCVTCAPAHESRDAAV